MLNGTLYMLPRLSEALADTQVSDYERRVLQFCQQWLTGQSTFTVHTSGSTGQPKAIFLTRTQMATSARWTASALSLQPGDRALVCLSVDYIAGMMMIVRGLELGLHLAITDPVSQPLAQFPPTTHFDFTAMVPLQLHETLHGSPHELAILHRMKGILIGGAPVSRALEEQAQQVTAPLYHTYGMTETVSHIALRRMNGPQRSDCFVPFDEVGLGLDARGCLTITSALTRGETLQTNDLVEFQADGSFRWLGRIDNVINSGGVKVQIEKVETALEVWLLHYKDGTYADRRFFVGPLAHPHLGQAVVAVVEGGPGDGRAVIAPEVEAALRAQLQQTLTPYEIPRKVYFVGQLLETPTGKIDRRANLERVARFAKIPPPSPFTNGENGGAERSIPDFH
jgi:O-succinylbenzoic acid--CoA ligase